MTYRPLKKTKPANWLAVNTPATRAMKAKLRPENTRAGGIKPRSGSEAVRMAVYIAIAELFKRANPWCESCRIIQGAEGYAPEERTQRPTVDVHHQRGTDGLLRFDVRYFLPVCRVCHRWVDANRDQARALGLLAGKGEWNQIKTIAPNKSDL